MLVEMIRFPMKPMLKYPVRKFPFVAAANKFRSTDAKSSPIANTYNYLEVEKNWYSKWEKAGQFKPDPGAKKENTFCLLLPPPNVTGTLHLGHALTGSVQDALVRWHRMSGKSVVWIPGLDHAGIATQTVVEKHLAANNLGSRHSLGRDRFLQEAWKWKESKGSVILQQLRSLGCSLDWTREYFTFDKERSAAVVEAFILLFERGLIFRTEALVNWSCQLQSAIADIEVDWLQLEGPTSLAVPGYDHKVKFGELTHVALPVEGEDAEVVVATTRLETMVGDTAVAVHPQDQRYASFIGKFVRHPLRPEAKIPILADDFVDPEFGTGVVKITPAHDAADFEVGKRHNLEFISVFSGDGLILPNGGSFAGMKRFQAREEIRKHLSSLGLLRGTTALPNAKIPICSRSGDVVELIIKPQWFVDCQEMAKGAVNALETGELKIQPEDFNSSWNNWLNDIKDWCISRQLWWGHQIPAYLCKCPESKTEVWVAAENAEVARKKAAIKFGSTNFTVTQDQDVLDTWFSSALLPFAALGWPQKTKDLQQFYPNSLMETGNDILFFWVARMVMLGKELTGQLPFKNILFHGLICDAQGKKMSKSLGNVISPEDIVHGISLENLIARIKNTSMDKADLEKAIKTQKSSFPKGIPACGTDALRFTLCSYNTKAHVMNFAVDLCMLNRNFCNKIWQASKFVLNSLNETDATLAPYDLVNLQLSTMDKWILSRLADTVAVVDASFASTDLYKATAALKEFIYSNFCDVYIEASKALLANPATAASTRSVLLTCVHTSVHLLAPFMPFLSEQLYQHLPHQPESASVHTNQFPSAAEWAILKNPDAENVATDLIQVARAVRNLKDLCKLPRAQTEAIIETTDCNLFNEHSSVLMRLGLCANLKICDKISETRKSVSSAVNTNTKVYVIGEDKGANVATKLANLISQERTLAKRLSTGYQQNVPESQKKAAKIKKLEEIRQQIAELSSQNTVKQ